jgi:hypothetical protein
LLGLEFQGVFYLGDGLLKVLDLLAGLGELEVVLEIQLLDGLRELLALVAFFGFGDQELLFYLGFFRFEAWFDDGGGWLTNCSVTFNNNKLFLFFFFLWGLLVYGINENNLIEVYSFTFLQSLVVNSVFLGLCEPILNSIFKILPKCLLIIFAFAEVQLKIRVLFGGDRLSHAIIKRAFEFFAFFKLLRLRLLDQAWFRINHYIQ